jgi:hypothetical protein
MQKHRTIVLAFALALVVALPALAAGPRPEVAAVGPIASVWSAKWAEVKAFLGNLLPSPFTAVASGGPAKGVPAPRP